MCRPVATPGPALALSALLCAAPSAFAQGADADAGAVPSATLPAVEVTGRRAGSLTQPGVEEQRRAVERTPAAVRFVPS